MNRSDTVRVSIDAALLSCVQWTFVAFFFFGPLCPKHVVFKLARISPANLPHRDLRTRRHQGLLQPAALVPITC
jgi:hypothetical protein